MNSKLIIIVVLLIIIISTFFNISGIVRDIKVSELLDYSKNAKQVDTLEQNLDTATKAAESVDKSRDIEAIFIGIIIAVQVLLLVAFIIQDERKVSIPIILIIVAITFLPVRYTLAVDENNQVEKHHINIYHMEYVEGKNARFSFDSEY